MKTNTIILFLLFILLTSFSGSNDKDSFSRPGKDYALFFAVDDYTYWGKLRKPISDATKIAEELQTNYGFQTEVIKNPTKREIIMKLQEYVRKSFSHDDSQLFIFFSGHGEFTITQEGFFIPVDGRKKDPTQESYFGYNRLKSIVNSIPCKHILLGIDACYSGTFDAEIAQLKGDERPNAQQNQRGKFIQRNLKYKSRLFITSGGKERTPDPSQFARQILKALRGFGGEDRILTLTELGTYLESASPQPKIGEFGQSEAGATFLFVLEDGNNTSSSRSTSSNIIPESNQSSKKIIFKGNKGVFTDNRDGQSYKWVKMKDGKIWMAENLNYKTSESYCYDNRESNCNKYGRLYLWQDAKTACPQGWHLPNNKEWITLFDNYGGLTNSYEKLINGGESSFSALLGGWLQNKNKGDYYYEGKFGTYWSVTESEYDDDEALYYSFTKSSVTVDLLYGKKKENALSCRCIKD